MWTNASKNDIHYNNSLNIYGWHNPPPIFFSFFLVGLPISIKAPLINLEMAISFLFHINQSIKTLPKKNNSIHLFNQNTKTTWQSSHPFICIQNQESNPNFQSSIHEVITCVCELLNVHKSNTPSSNINFHHSSLFFFKKYIR